MLGHFSKRLREERNRLGLSQDEFAKKADVTKNTQLAYEQGVRPPDVLYLYRIADAGVDLFYLLGRDGDWAKLAPEIAELIRAFRVLTPTHQALVMGMIVLLGGTSPGTADSLADIWRTVRLLKRMAHASAEEKAMIERAVDALLGGSDEPPGAGLA
jgi:transcriptional regulator with XRE-family HTH domain